MRQTILVGVIAGGFLLAAGWVSGCADRVLKESGSACNATSECVEGLTCDFGQDPPVCSTGQTGGGAGGDGDGVDAGPDA